MPYNDSSQNFSRELDSIAQEASRVQSRLESQRSASLSFLSSLAKQELDIEVQCADKALKAKVDNIKKSQTARKTEVDDFTKNWSDALLQSEKNVSASAQNVIGNLDSQYQAYFDAADSSLEHNLQAMQAADTANGSSTQLFISAWERAFSSTQTKATSFGGFMQNFLENLGKAYAKNVLDIFTQKTEGTGFGTVFSVLSKTLGGFFADGGRPPVSKISIVGEKGPELFVPDAAGTIVSNSQLTGASQSQALSVNQYFSFQSLDPVTNMKMLEQQKNQIQRWVVEGIQANQNNLRNAVNGA